MGKSQKDTTYTTLTETQQTTLLKTSSAYPQQNIEQNIRKRKESEGSNQTNWSTWAELDPYPQGGTVLKKVELGIGNTQKCPLKTRMQLNPIVKWFRWRWRAGCVQYYSYQRTPLNSTTAPTSALAEHRLPRKGLACLVQVLKSACGVAKIYSPCIVDRDFVTTFAKAHSVTPKGKPQKVYNITVEDAQTYYANGILTHNCDTVSMAMSRFRKGGFITTNLDEPEPEQEFKGRGSRRNAYY
jgi:hypothetical protein